MDNEELTKRQIFELYIKVINQQDENDKYMKERIKEELQKLEHDFGSMVRLNLTEIHTIACIGDHEPINVTALSEKMNVTKGTVSKISSKLLEMDFIRKTQLSDNKKEIYFCLTPKGKKIFHIHARLHQEVADRFMNNLAPYSPEELLFIKKLFRDLLEWKY
jgi:DNA-binding MarR family transcriptional regulator